MIDFNSVIFPYHLSLFEQGNFIFSLFFPILFTPILTIC